MRYWSDIYDKDIEYQDIYDKNIDYQDIYDKDIEYQDIEVTLMTKILNTVVDDLDRDELPWTYRSHTHYNKAILGDKRPSPPEKEEENN